MARFQTFEDSTIPHPRVRNASPSCRAELARAAILPALSCPAPTSTSRNTCRRTPSASPGSPASRGLPARPSCLSRQGSARGGWPLHHPSTGAGGHERDHPSEARRSEPGGLDRHEPAGQNGALAYDPWLHTPSSLKRLEAAVTRAGGKLVPVDTNLVDVIWADRPSAPLALVRPHPIGMQVRALPRSSAASARS